MENNIIILFLCFFNFSSKTKNRDNPIKKYNVVQTGPKIKLGGLKKGLLRLAYHVGIWESVKTEPKIPIASQININNVNLQSLFTTLSSQPRKYMSIHLYWRVRGTFTLSISLPSLAL